MAVITFSLLAAVLVGAESSAGEVAASRDLMVSWHGELTPRILPRLVPAPATFRLSFKSRFTNSTESTEVPQLSRFGFDLGRPVVIDPAGLRPCSPRILFQPDIPQTACDRSLVGHGSITSEITLPEQGLTQVGGRFHAFYSHEGGHPGIVAVAKARLPAPTYFLIPFTLAKSRSALPGARIFVPEGAIPQRWSRISAFEISLHRVFMHEGERESFLSATCPYAGSIEPPFTFLRAIFTYANGETLEGLSPRPRCSIAR